MPAKDIYHETMKNALVKEEWTITDDPLRLKWGSRELFVDLGISKLISAQKANRKIAVEIKSFTNPSPIVDLEQALGQYLIYQAVLEETKPEYLLYLAIPKTTYGAIFSEPIGNLILKKYLLNLIVFDPKKEEVCQWIP